ncbi:MAG: hypothetical protein H6Q90_276 [Deltaproteobacteria bacterium]|nr:hypothetical protein [Deltaproteobacteria bacterium]
MSLRKLSLALVLAACGGGGGSNNNSPDAAPLPDSQPLPPDGPVLPVGCDYAELNDASNDDLSASGAAEATNITFAASTVLCGKLDSTHFAPAQNVGDPGLVDIDSFAVTLAADASVLVTLAGAGAEALTEVDVVVFDDQGNAASSGVLQTSHAVFIADLPAGSYKFSAIASNAAATTAAIDYKIKIVTDVPATRCPQSADTATFTEANDGGASVGNDMLDVQFNVDPNVAITAATDTPEPTGVVTAAGTKYRLSGVSGNVNAADEYTDRDTFLIETGADTNQLTIRLNWTGTTSDHDYMVFEENTIVDIASSTNISDSSDTNPEFQTFPVKPSTRYWVWTGTYDTLADNATAPTLPAPYDLSVCAESFTP